MLITLIKLLITFDPGFSGVNKIGYIYTINKR